MSKNSGKRKESNLKNTMNNKRKKNKESKKNSTIRADDDPCTNEVILNKDIEGTFDNKSVLGERSLISREKDFEKIAELKK